jgi:outer membrane protein assembly factor BamB
MLVGRPEWPYLAQVAAGVFLLMALTFDLAAPLGGLRWPRWVLGLVAASWLLVNAALIWFKVESPIGTPVMVLLYLPASLWVLWTAWMFYGRLPFAARWGVLALFVVAAVGFPRLVAMDNGLSGEGNARFNWRWEVANRGRVQETPAFVGTVDLERTTPQDYAQFLGPQRLGVLPDVRLARDWNAAPPREVWRQPVGAGWGAFAVAGNYAVTQEQHGDDECAVCYRISDGARAWVHADKGRFETSLGGPGPRATPTIVDGRVYTLGATGLLNCLDGATGQPIWSINVLTDNQAENISHGVASSPLVVDDLVIVCPTGYGGPSLVAYHRDTGQRVWQAGQDQASYGSPLLAELGGVRQILLYTSVGVTGHDARSGQVLWSFPWTNNEGVNCSQPIPHAGGPYQVFAGTGYGKGSALFRVQQSADGNWSTERVWEKREMKTKFTTAVLHKGYLYGLDDGILACVDVKTGKRQWRDGRYQHGQILLAGDLLLVQAENGKVILVEPAPDGLHELGRIPALDGKTWNNPALAGRFLLVRNAEEAACYELPLKRD